MKKRGFGEGKWNGFGGKVDPGESIIEAAQRELEEECGIRAKEPVKTGVITFTYKDSNSTMEVHIYSDHLYSGEITESEEMKPQWWAYKQVRRTLTTNTLSTNTLSCCPLPMPTGPFPLHVGR